MLQIAEQTHEEKVKMYMRLSKKDLAEMLIHANLTLSGLIQLHSYPIKFEYIKSPDDYELTSTIMNDDGLPIKIATRINNWKP